MAHRPSRQTFSIVALSLLAVYWGDSLHSQTPAVKSTGAKAPPAKPFVGCNSEGFDAENGDLRKLCENTATPGGGGTGSGGNETDVTWQQSLQEECSLTGTQR